MSLTFRSNALRTFTSWLTSHLHLFLARCEVEVVAEREIGVIEEDSVAEVMTAAGAVECAEEATTGAEEEVTAAVDVVALIVEEATGVVVAMDMTAVDMMVEKVDMRAEEADMRAEEADMRAEEADVDAITLVTGVLATSETSSGTNNGTTHRVLRPSTSIRTRIRTKAHKASRHRHTRLLRYRCLLSLVSLRRSNSRPVRTKGGSNPRRFHSSRSSHCHSSSLVCRRFLRLHPQLRLPYRPGPMSTRTSMEHRRARLPHSSSRPLSFQRGCRRSCSRSSRSSSLVEIATRRLEHCRTRWHC
jgi:hypothetical protein